MTLFDSASSKLREQGFTASDIRAIFAIMAAMPYSVDLFHLKDFDAENDFTKEPDLPGKFNNQVQAIARMYQTHFKNAGDRKGEGAR